MTFWQLNAYPGSRGKISLQFRSAASSHFVVVAKVPVRLISVNSVHVFLHCGIALNAKFIRSTQTKPESVSTIKFNWIWCSVSCNLAKRFCSNGFWWPYVEPVHKQCYLISTVLLNIRISSKTHLLRFGHWQTPEDFCTLHSTDLPWIVLVRSGHLNL